MSSSIPERVSSVLSTAASESQPAYAFAKPFHGVLQEDDDLNALLSQLNLAPQASQVCTASVQDLFCCTMQSMLETYLDSQMRLLQRLLSLSGCVSCLLQAAARQPLLDSFDLKGIAERIKSGMVLQQLLCHSWSCSSWCSKAHACSLYLPFPEVKPLFGC